MSNAFVQQKTVQSTSSVSSLTTTSMTVTAGNELVSATCGSTNVSSVPPDLATTDSKSDLFVKEVTRQSDQFGAIQLEFSSGAVGGATTFTVTPNFSTFISIAVKEYSGVADYPVESSVNAQGFGQLFSPGALLPPSVGDLYISAWTHAGSGSQTFTAASGWTLRSNLTNTANMPLGSEDFIGSGSQVGSCSISGGTDVSWGCVAIALRAADVAAHNDEDSPNYAQPEFPMTDRGFNEPG